MSIYQERGYRDRAEYLRELADENGADLEAVQLVADILGPDEDFDGLRVMVEDWDWDAAD